MFINNFDPVAFQVFSIGIRWYSLAYVVGLVLGWLYCNKILIKDKDKKNNFDQYKNNIIETPEPNIIIIYLGSEHIDCS